MIRFPRTLEDAARAGAEHVEIRAGGTDVQERRHSGLSGGPLVDLTRIPQFDRLGWMEGGLSIGAGVTLANLARSTMVQRGYPGVAEAAGALATPQIRAVATLGGSLLQRSRCWYFRNPAFDCLKTGGATCPARDGDHLFHVCIDYGPCAAPHPSTMGMALLAYDAMVDVHGAEPMSIADLFGDGSDPTREHVLEPGDVLSGVRLPAPVVGERAAYFRTIARARAEWPLVEVLARVVVTQGRVSMARVTMGGVANIPLRLRRVEAALVGKQPDGDALDAAAGLAVEGAQPLEMTGYKVTLIPGTVRETLERALAATATTSDVPGRPTPEGG